MLAQLRQDNLNMLLVLLSSLAEDEDVISEYNSKLTQLIPRVQATISFELMLFEIHWSVQTQKVTFARDLLKLGL